MKRTEISSLGFKVTHEVPETAQEFDQLAKKENAVVEQASANVLYRSTFPVFRELFCEALEKETGITREKNSDGDPSEKELVYVNRVFTTIAEREGIADLQIVRSRYQDLAQRCMDEAPFDPSERERKAPVGGGLKTAMKTVEALLAAGKEAEKIAQYFTNKLGYTVASDKDSLAKAVAEDTRRKREAEKLALSAEIG